MRSHSIAPPEVSSRNPLEVCSIACSSTPIANRAPCACGSAREHGRREQRVRLALERTEQASAHGRREIRRDEAEIGSREQLDLESGRAFDRRFPLHRSEVRLGVGGEQAAGQLDLQIDAELRR